MYLWTFEERENGYGRTIKAVTVTAATFENAIERAAANGVIYDGVHAYAIVNRNNARNYFKYCVICGGYTMYQPTKKGAIRYAKKHNGKIIFP